jgi:hypothetical protein
MKAGAILFILAVCSPALAAVPPATTTATTQSFDLRAPTRVTLKLDHTPAVEALRALFKQAGIASDDILTDGFAQQMADVTVTADLADRPFCAALVEICRQAYLEPEFINLPQSGRTLQLVIRRPRVGVPRSRATTRPAAATTRATTRSIMRGVVFRAAPRFAGPATAGATTQPSWVDAPMAASGPFVFVAHDAHRFSRIDFESDRGAADPIRTLELNFLVLRDPKLRLMALGERIDVDEASDDAGVSLLRDPPVEPAEVRPAANRLMNPSRVSAVLTYPPGETSHAIALFRGRLGATIVSRTQPVELVKDGAAVKAGAAQSAGEVHFVVEKFEPFGGGGGMQIVMTIPYAGPDGQSHGEEVRALVHPDLLRLFDADGNRAGDFSVTTSVHSFRSDTGDYGVTVTIHPFRPPGRGGAGGGPTKPARVVWDVPLEVTDVSIPVELKNLPLP